MIKKYYSNNTPSYNGIVSLKKSIQKDALSDGFDGCMYYSLDSLESLDSLDSLESLDYKVDLIDDFIDSKFLKRLDFSFEGVVLINSFNSFIVTCSDINFF